MAADVANAIVRFTTTGQYPDDENIIASELTPATLSSVFETFRQAREEVRREVQALSKTTGSNVEEWIGLAKRLQDDIQQSRDVARSIVEQNEITNKLKEELRDTASKIEFLEKEIQYEASLEETLLRIGHANDVLLQTQDALINSDVTEALRLLRASRDAVTALGDTANTKAVSILDARGRQLKSTIEETITQSWKGLIEVDTRRGQVIIHQELPDRTNNSIETISKAAEDTGTLPRLVEKLAKDIDRAITQRVFSAYNSDKQVNVLVKSDNAEVTFSSDDGSGDSLTSFFTDLLSFFASQFPERVRTPFIATYLPSLVNTMEERWLKVSVPTDIKQISAFSRTIDQVERLAAQFDVLQWPGASQLRDWVENVPATWLTKRREALLGMARDIVFEKIHDTKTVQRVETQVIGTQEDSQTEPQVTEDWDNAWDEDETSSKIKSTKDPSASQTETHTEEDDGSAWDLEDAGSTKEETKEDEEAWGWGDDTNQDASAAPQTPVRSHTKTEAPQQQTRTLSETYTVTAIPDSLVDLIEAVVADAQTLCGAEYSDSPLSHAAAGLYSLPTLAIAIYRATAPTVYAELPAGNMMIYSDATRLSERLRAWQASQAPASRLRLDNDAKALDDFARRAYGAEMDAQRTVMRDLLDDAQGFASCTVPPFKAACESAVAQSVDRLHEVHRTWKGILAPSALPQAVGQLLSTLTGKMIADIEDLSDISEAESQQLRVLCDRVTSVKELFVPDNADNGVSDLTFVYCPNWLKFQYLAEILESSLADIRYLWTEGELSLEFEADAVVDLIKALFAESDKRRQAIAEIKRGSRR